MSAGQIFLGVGADLICDRPRKLYVRPSDFENHWFRVYVFFDLAPQLYFQPLYLTFIDA
jgi:hypothetical protein